MPAEVVTSVWCADYEATFEVQGSKGKTWRVVTDGVAIHCNCPAFKYSAAEPQEKHCKHATAVWEKGCFWNTQWYDGGTCELRPTARHGSHVVPGEECPNCHGPVLAVRIAV